ncbi:glycosyltransferase family protein [Azospirillum doebereinerae]|uniref:glycosyltransferase family protein n=1 Tax=Azospirillum doebereinerae TaxID=92933 RepID=UPI001EE62A79|nr:glycosyltransferase [Azospirillum doebereinerae]MCG5238605.1 glycosyltransferase [Azospirillum doebereinerae]
MRVMIVVTHLLGSGHLARALALADAFARAGWAADVVSGGRPAPHLAPGRATLHQLPPLASAGTDFRTLLTADGRVAGPDDHAERRERLTDLLSALRPDALITELFPFGRRTLAGEFDALLEQARAMPRPPLVLSSVRDILAPPSRPGRLPETEERLRRFYDGVLVHSDPAVIPLEDSWPLTPPMRKMLLYTGFVAPSRPNLADGDEGRDEILVTAGGGPVGRVIFETAARCARAGVLPYRWRLLVPPDEVEAVGHLRALAPAQRLTIEPLRPDFRSLLGRAAASVGRCGYNTALDCLALGVPSVFCPFEDGNETEQITRARILARRPGIAMLREADLSPDRLAAALSGVLGVAVPRLNPAVLAGAARSVEIVTAMLGERRI